ncbi:sulfotransferase [Amylibacter sp. SFDW26]|uniref:sulfotransferase family protein n=1 Tax=Amylibacter sp. SFDW26 TaxID=2652722 RepID=UPI001261E7B2|nr:sulfotransferase [Amylibacter sp. SFDW26]KAB7609843.1 sulfotransferase [Amylibacter sp. SFDW26]
MNADFTPVIIIGAGRSGTNLLRDCLTRLPEFETWQCDEIQPIWRHKNVRFKTDELPASRVSPDVKKFIRNAFNKLWRQTGHPKFVVEKTCANTLRIPFVDAVLPEAVYIHLIRHGADVVRSAEKRWRGDLEVPSFAYYAAKARFIPFSDLWLYLWEFVSKRTFMVLGQEERLSTWGPRFEGIDDWSDRDLDEVCAKQWSCCVSSTLNALADIDSKRQITIYYEDLVLNPTAELERVLNALDVRLPVSMINEAVAIVRTKESNKGVRDVKNKKVLDILTPALKALGYGITK